MSSLAISASARGMAADSSSARQMKKTTKTYVYKTDSDGNVTSHTDVQVSGSSMSESGESHDGVSDSPVRSSLQPP